MPEHCETCKADVVEIARTTAGTPTAKLIAILMSQGVDNTADLAAITGLTKRAIQYTCEAHFAKPASQVRNQLRQTKPISRNQLRLSHARLRNLLRR